MSNISIANLLVPGEHPHHDAGLPEVVDGLGHALLQPVLDPRGAQEVQLALDAVERVQEQLLAAVQGVLKKNCIEK